MLLLDLIQTLFFVFLDTDPTLNTPPQDTRLSSALSSDDRNLSTRGSSTGSGISEARMSHHSATQNTTHK